MFAPNSRYRALITPAGRGRCGKADPNRSEAQKRQARPKAQRLKRVFRIDIETCEYCGGAVRVTDVFARLAGAGEVAYRPSWYRGDFDTRHLHRFTSNVGKTLSSAIASSSRPPGSSSGGGGGGFSGGGGGGGGW